MSEMIVQVRNKILRRIGGVNHFVSHNKDYTIQFQFDESWGNVRTKMAVFAYEDGEYGSEIFDGDTCNVPELPREGRILIGVKAGEDLSTELLYIPVCKSADDVITDEYNEPDPKIYEQILDIINNLWNGGTTVYPSPVKFLASPSTAKVGDLIRVKEVDENGDVTRTEGFDVGVELEKKIDAPQAAQVGEVLTVEEVDAEGKPKKWKTQTVETAPPDWMENDSNNPGFVKNRTHYKQIMAVAGNPGYKVNLLDGTHRVGDIILLQSGTTTLLQKFLMRGINSPDWDIYELCMLIKETDNNDKTYNLEVICKDRENIVEVNTLSEGNIKVLYSEQKKAFLAYYFISNLSTLSTDDKTKFTQTGVYVQLVGNDYSEYAELWATYRLYLYSKLSNKYLNIRQDPPDWNENDPTKPGYIKNRPFYKSDENPLGTLTFTATATNELAYTVTEMGIDTIAGIYNMTKIDVGGGVPKGQLRVVVSGQSYLTELESDRGHFGFSGSGISGHGYYRTGDATIITIDDGSMSLTVGEFYDVSFFDINSSGYVKIPTEYFSKEVFTQNSAPVKYGDGNQSTIQGDSTKATGYSSHAEGNGTKALERSSHAEGSYTTASGEVSHAEGNYTTASGDDSHAEGYLTEAFGSSSHAEGYHTVASNKNMHTSGKYNVIEPRYKIYYRTGNYFFNKNAEYYCSDTYTLDQKTGKFTLNNAIKKIFTQCMGKYVSMDSVSENVNGVFKVLSTASGSTANYYPCNYYYSETLANDIGTYSHIVGNGTSDTERSNSYTLDWEGNAWFAGDVYVHSTSGTNKDDGSVRLVTEDQLTFCNRLVIWPKKNNDGTITYSTNFYALFVYYEIFKGSPIDAGNSVECCLIPIEGASPLTVLNYTGMSIDQNSDGNIVLTIRFSSYTSGKQISAEIKDTISGFGTDNENRLSTVATVTENALVSCSMIQELTHEQQELAKQNIGAGTLRKVYYWDVADDTPEAPNSVMRCAEYGDTCICLNDAMLPHGMVGPVLVIYGEISYGRRDATAFDGSNATWTFSVNLSDYSYSTPIKKSGIPTPTTAQVGQIVKVKAVDADGKITETETVNIPTIPQPLAGYKMIATEQIGENEFGYTLRPIPNINDFINLGITSAQVGQIIKVKAVDDFGNPTEWEAVDMSTIVSVTYDEKTGNLQIGG